MNFAPYTFMEDWGTLHYVLVGLIIVLIVLSIILLIGIANSRARKNQSDARKAKLTEQLATRLMPMFYEDLVTLKRACEKFRPRFLRTTENKELLVSILHDQTKNFSGDAFEKVQAIYQWLNLHRFSQSKLKSPFWEVMCQGLVELAAFKHQPSLKKIQKLLEHKHKLVRKVALQAFVEISSLEKFPKKELFELNREIALWEQIIMYQKLHDSETRDEWDLTELLKAKDSVFAFGLKVACLGNSTNIDHPDVFKRAQELQDEEALVAFIEWLSRFEVLPPLYEMFQNRLNYSIRVQRCLIKNCSSIEGIEEDLLNIFNKGPRSLAAAAATVMVNKAIGDPKTPIALEEDRKYLMEASQHPLAYV